MTSRRWGICAITTLSLLARTAAADEPTLPDVAEAERSSETEPIRALPCRPTIACTAELVPAGSFEVELGYAQRRASGSAASHGVQALTKYSVTDRLQLQLGSNGMFIGQPGASPRMFDGVFGGPKLLFVTQGSFVPSLAASFFIAAPTRFGNDAATKTYDADVWVYASKDIKGFHADLNVGVDILSVDRSPSLQAVTALAISHDLFWGLGLMGELYGFHGGRPYADHDAGFLSAISYSPVPELAIDAGVDIALYTDVRTMTGFAGFTVVPGAVITNHRSSRALRSALAK